jgi:hypothetical protein
MNSPDGHGPAPATGTISGARLADHQLSAVSLPSSARCIRSQWHGRAVRRAMTYQSDESPKDTCPTTSTAALLAGYEGPGLVPMSTLATVIPFPERSQKNVHRLSFSPNDAGLIANVFVFLSAEMTSSVPGYETQARMFFYLGLHRYAMRRWLGLLDAQASAYSSDLSKRIREAFEYLTSQSIIENNAPNDQLYHSKVARLSDSMWSLLQLIRTHQGNENT